MSGQPPSFDWQAIKSPSRQNAAGANRPTTFNSNPHLVNMGSPFGPSVTSTSSATPTCPFFAGTREEVKVPLLDPNMPTTSPNAEHHPTQGEPDMKPSNNFNAENAITLLVGPEQQKLVVHASYITRTSAFFATAFKKEWAEGQTRTIELHEEAPEMMAHYLDWVYTSKLPTKECSLFHPESAKITAHNLLAELYVLGERRLDSEFRNAITAELVRLRLILHGSPGCRASQRVTSVNTIYEGTPAGSPARRLMVDLSLRFGCHQCYTGDLDKAFLVDLTHAFFVAAHLPKGVEGQRGLEPKAEEYRV